MSPDIENLLFTEVVWKECLHEQDRLCMTLSVLGMRFPPGICSVVTLPWTGGLKERSTGCPQVSGSIQPRISLFFLQSLEYCLLYNRCSKHVYLTEMINPKWYVTAPRVTTWGTLPSVRILGGLQQMAASGSAWESLVKLLQRWVLAAAVSKTPLVVITHRL